MYKKIFDNSLYILIEFYIISSTAVFSSVSLKPAHFYFQVNASPFLLTLGFDKEGSIIISVTGIYYLCNNVAL